MSLPHLIPIRYMNAVRILQYIGALCIALLGQITLTLPAQATAPTYSVSISGGGLSPNPICDGMSASGTFNGSLQISNPNNEYAMSTQSWSWTAAATAYAVNSTATYGSLSGVTAPTISIHGGGTATGSLTVTSGPSTTPGDYQITVTGTDNFYVTDNTTHPSTDTYYNPSNIAFASIVNVTIGSVQYKNPDDGNNYDPISGTMFVVKSASVSFKAIPNPSDASFPNGKPTWGGTSGASGSGATASATFSSLSATASDYKTVTVTLNPANGVTTAANAIVANLTAALTFPDDGLADHAPTSVGPLENANISVATGIALVNASSFGQMAWSTPTLRYGEVFTSGTGSTATFTAGYQADNVTTTLSLTSGLSKGQVSPSLSISVVGIGTGIEKQLKDSTGNATNEHVQYNAWLAAHGVDVLSSSGGDVSLDHVQFTEYDAYCTATGLLATAPGSLNGTSHLNGTTTLTPNSAVPWSNVNYFSVPQEWHSANIDSFGIKHAPASGSGASASYGAATDPSATFTVAIPWMYRVAKADGTFATPVSITTKTQSGSVTTGLGNAGGGNTTITKDFSQSVAANSASTTLSP